MHLIKYDISQILISCPQSTYIHSTHVQLECLIWTSWVERNSWLIYTDCVCLVPIVHTAAARITYSEEKEDIFMMFTLTVLLCQHIFVFFLSWGQSSFAYEFLIFNSCIFTSLVERRLLTNLSTNLIMLENNFSFNTL